MVHSELAGLFLLFPAGKRPTRAALRDFAAGQRLVSLTLDPAVDAFPRPVEPGMAEPAAAAAASSQMDEAGWVELLREGLTFDLVGIAPGEAATFPEIENRFDLEARPNGLRYEALHLVPGQHLSGGQRSLPVAKGLIGLARDLTNHFDQLEAVVWPPAKAGIGRRFFESIATAWLEGGPFPALGLTAFRETMDGAVQSVGLEFWIGQELRIEPPLSGDRVAATRLGVRLINQLILIGGLDESERIVAPDGTRLVMRPSRNGRFIRVWRE
ncbi:MAG: hypothetical protein V2J14_02045 [Erythrobacter sp.]|jgi:hypothetical protein|nr:hypothetical protein [Erythrobacter sp.]